MKKITIDFVTRGIYDLKNKEKNSFKTLSFSIEGKLDKLFEIEDSTTVDFSDYIDEAETYFPINDMSCFANLDIKVTKYLKHKFCF